MKLIYNQIKLGENNQALMDANCKNFEAILGFLTLDLRDKVRKNILEMVKSLFLLDPMASLFNRKPDILDKLLGLLFNMNEADGLKVMKSFHNFLFANFKKLLPEQERLLVRIYYGQIGNFSAVLASELGSGSYKERFGEEVAADKALCFKDSVIIHDEFFNHLKMIMEKNFLSPEEMRGLMEKYLELLLRVRLADAHRVMHRTYFINLLQIASKLLNFFSIILVNKKDSNPPSENEFFKSVGLVFESKPTRVTDLVRFSIGFLVSVPIEFTKFKVDAFGFVRNFCDNYSESIIENLKRLLTDEFFVNRSKIKFSELEINRIYYYWISSHKVLIRTFKKVLLQKLDVEVVFLMIENNINILFEENIHPNYLLNTLHNIGSLCEIMKEKLTGLNESLPPGEREPRMANYGNYVFLLIKKLVRYLKHSCSCIQDLVEYLKREEKNHRKGRFDQFIHLPGEEMMRYVEEHSDEILEEEMILKNTFSSRYASDVLIQYSFNIQSDRNYKFETFLDDSIVKKIGLLNEILVKYTVEYFRISFMCERERVIPESGAAKGALLFIRSLRMAEKAVLQKILVKNLQIFSLLICNAKHIEYQKIYENIKFSVLEIFCLKNCFVPGDHASPANQSPRNVLVRFRDIHRIFDGIGDKLLLTFVDIYLSSNENYSNNYTLIIDIFSGSGIVDSLNKADTDMFQTARMTIRSFNEVVITKVIEVMQKRCVDYFDPLSSRVSKQDDVKTFCVRILKGIYRKIKYRNSSNNDQVNVNDVIDIKEVTFKLILVIMEKTYSEPNVMGVLQLLQNIFNIVFKITPFVNYFTEEVTRNGVKIMGYLFSIFTTNYAELRIIAVELLIFAPVDIRKVLKAEVKKPHDLRRFFDMLELALELNENSFLQRALILLDTAINHVDSSDLRLVFNDKLASIYDRLASLISNSDNRFSVLRKNATYDVVKAKFASKILGKLGDFLQDCREVNSFKVKKSILSLDEFELEVGSNFANGFVSALSLKEYIEVLYSELRKMKDRPWFNNFYNISLNYIFFCTIKHKRGLEKLFELLLRILRQLDEAVEVADEGDQAMRIEADLSDNNPFYDKTFECLFNLVFFMYPFKIADSQENNLELGAFQQYLSTAAAANPKKALRFSSLIMRNTMLSLDLVSEEMDLTIYNFVKGYLEQLLFAEAPVEGMHDVFLEELMSLFSNSCVYGINAALFFFKQLILDQWDRSRAFTEAVRVKKMHLIKGLLLANTFLDKKLNLKINKMMLGCFEEFIVRCVQETDDSGQSIISSDLDEFFANLKNFEDSEVFLVMVRLSRNEARHYPNFFKGMRKIVNRQMNTYMKALKYSSEDKAVQWSFEFLQAIKGLLIKLLYAFDLGKYQKDINEVNENAKTVLCFIIQIREELILYDRREREFKSSTIQPVNEPTQQLYVNNNNLYYTDFDLKIHVDKYDYIIKEFCVIFEKCTEVVSKFFQNNRFENAQPDSADSQSEEFRRLRTEYQRQKENSFNKLMDLCLRCEKKIIKAVLKIVPHSIPAESRDGNRDQLTQFKVLLKLFSKNEIKEHNLYIISKLVKNYPKLVNSDG
jgi:hypothetical protein